MNRVSELEMRTCLSVSPLEQTHQLIAGKQCSCCESYGAYFEANGYPVKMVATHDLFLIKERH